MITPGFQYDTKKLQKTEGFPEVARDMVKSRSSDARDMIKWTSEAMGMRAEEKVFNMLERRFYNEPCLLLPGYVETHIFRVARAVLPGIVEDDFPLSAEVYNALAFTVEMPSKHKYFRSWRYGTQSVELILNSLLKMFGPG